MKREPTLAGKLLRGTLALMLLLQLTLVQAMAASADLHHDCHHHSHEHNHQCEVTLWLQTGGGEVSVPVELPVGKVVAPATPPLPLSSEEIFLTPPQLLGGISAHGPPRAP